MSSGSGVTRSSRVTTPIDNNHYPAGLVSRRFGAVTHSEIISVLVDLRKACLTSLPQLLPNFARSL